MPKLKGVITGVAISTALAGGLVGMSALTATASAGVDRDVPAFRAGDHCRGDNHHRHFNRRGINVTVQNRNCTNNVNLNDEERSVKEKIG
ncbi:hypothetical protein [Nonomuraea glycinis]|uniref:hypothetical protein n=1 Tax=Nonomuraea glycinis TaxID=2047744 RepID=UPI002E1192C8|nr:hypothetical protein OHA68_05260 [Nonomuraea glycinis]